MEAIAILKAAFRTEVEQRFSRMTENPNGTGYLHSVTFADGGEVRLSVQRQSDDAFYIEEASIIESTLSPAPSCEVGMMLQIGQACELPDGGEFYVKDNGDGCLGTRGSYCSFTLGSGIIINNFSVRKGNGDSWTITSMP